MIVSMQNVEKRYRSGEGVQSLNLQIPAGQIIGLLGPNGSGKTTTMKLISGLLKAGGGKVTVADAVPRASRNNVAFLGDRQGFPSWMDSAAILRFMATFFADFDVSRFEKLLEELAIPRRPLGEMSRGQRQKLKLAATMARNVPLYLLDEPLAGIDLVARTGILKSLIAYWRPQSSVLLATHEISDVEAYLHRAVFLSGGRIVADELTADLRDQGHSVAERYLELMGGSL